MYVHSGIIPVCTNKMNLETGLLDRFLRIEWFLRGIQSSKSKTQFLLKAIEKHIFSTLCELQHKSVCSLFSLFYSLKKCFHSLLPRKQKNKQKTQKYVSYKKNIKK